MDVLPEEILIDSKEKEERIKDLDQQIRKKIPELFKTTSELYEIVKERNNLIGRRHSFPIPLLNGLHLIENFRQRIAKTREPCGTQG